MVMLLVATVGMSALNGCAGSGADLNSSMGDQDTVSGGASDPPSDDANTSGSEIVVDTIDEDGFMLSWTIRYQDVADHVPGDALSTVCPDFDSYGAYEMYDIKKMQIIEIELNDETDDFTYPGPASIRWGNAEYDSAGPATCSTAGENYSLVPLVALDPGTHVEFGQVWSAASSPEHPDGDWPGGVATPWTSSYLVVGNSVESCSSRKGGDHVEFDVPTYQCRVFLNR